MDETLNEIPGVNEEQDVFDDVGLTDNDKQKMGNQIDDSYKIEDSNDAMIYDELEKMLNEISDVNESGSDDDRNC